MKILKLTLLITLIANFAFGQNLDHEDKLYYEYKKGREIQQQKIVQDISGLFDGISTITSQQIEPSWDECEGQGYEGLIEFELIEDGLYNVYSINPSGEKLNDMSFGTYYDCYGIVEQGGLPNIDEFFPTLFLKVTDAGELTFEGISQYDEIYTLANATYDGPELTFNWTNDYGEGAYVELIRQDGQNWEELLTPCVIDSESDSLALVALYNATNGPNWNIPWDLTRPVSEWYGITIDGDCKITEIDMGLSTELINLGFFSNNLSGTVPDEIGDISSLKVIDFGGNQLEGEILPKLTNLVNLESLNLSGNLFTGTIISELLNLENLEFITLSRNNFDGELPLEISTLPNLRTFFASDNNLSGEIPSEYGDFPSLNALSMWGNNFTGEIPSELSNLQELTTLTLDFNNLSGEIPASIGQIESLRFLRLSFNQLTGPIPEGFPSLAILRLNDNNFTGEFPSQFATLNLTNEINVSNNNLTGEIPSRFFSDNAFQELYFVNNDFSGCVDNIDMLCFQPLNTVLDTVLVGGVEILASYSIGFDLSGNPKLAWQGDFEGVCEGDDQIGAPCDDGDPDTTKDGIDENCNCVADVVSTKSIKGLNSFSISPNPLSSDEMINISIDLSNTINATVNLLDLDGKIINSLSLGNISGKKTYALSTDNLTSGLYFVQVATENGTATNKIIIQ